MVTNVSNDGHRHVALGVGLASLFPNQDDDEGDGVGPSVKPECNRMGLWRPQGINTKLRQAKL